MGVIILGGVSKGLCLAYIIKTVKFIKYDKYNTMVKTADVTEKIIEGNSISKAAHIVNGIYIVSQIAIAII